MGVQYPYFTPVRRGFPMVSTPLFYPLLLVALVLICLLMHVVWPDDPPRAPTPSPQPHQRRRRRVKELKSFPGFVHKPLCAACEQAADAQPKAPGFPPPIIRYTRGANRATASWVCAILDERSLWNNLQG